MKFFSSPRRVTRVARARAFFAAWRVAIPIAVLLWGVQRWARAPFAALSDTGTQARVTLNEVVLDTSQAPDAAPGSAPNSWRGIEVQDGATKAANRLRFDALKPGESSPWFALAPVPARLYAQLWVRAPARVKTMRITLEVADGRQPDQPSQVVQETVQGNEALFVRRVSPQTKQLVVLPASQVFREGLAQARKVAVPENQRPRRFIIADYVAGPGPCRQALDDALSTLALLGMNTVETRHWGELTGEVEQQARQAGFARFRSAVYAPPNYFTWPMPKSLGQSVDVRDAASVDAWARGQAEQHRKASGLPPSDVALFFLGDEPGWYFPDVMEQFMANPTEQEAFRAFLRNQGLQPADVGAASWAQVFPIGRSRAHDLPARRLFYWTARYPASVASATCGLWTQALRRHFNPDMAVAINWNNWISRFYKPSPNAKVGKSLSINADTALGGMDWMEAGRQRSVTALWSEDWFTDAMAQDWSYYADALRCAARGGDAQFGGYIVGRTLGVHPHAGCYRALALVGHGAKIIDWYTYGPEPLFAGNSYSDNLPAYQAIAEANRMIGRAEEMLYPGQRAPARVALLLPRSAQVWDDGPRPLYQHELNGIHFALTHSQYPVDFVDEEDVAAGALSRYAVLYVTTPNVSLVAQNALRDWVQAGGTAVFSPGAAAADEYNTPVNVLDEMRGVRVTPLARPQAGAPLPAAMDVSDAAQPVPVKVADARFGAGSGADLMASRQITLLQVTEAQVAATFPRGGVALATHRFGQGQAISYGFWPGQAYLLPLKRAVREEWPTGWEESLRQTIVAAPRLAGVARPVHLSHDIVEAARLDSASGTAIVLLNWTAQPIAPLTVTVRDASGVKSVTSVEQGALTFTREGDVLRVQMPLRYVDVLMLHR